VLHGLGAADGRSLPGLGGAAPVRRRSFNMRPRPLSASLVVCVPRRVSMRPGLLSASRGRVRDPHRPLQASPLLTRPAFDKLLSLRVLFVLVLFEFDALVLEAFVRQVASDESAPPARPAASAPRPGPRACARGRGAAPTRRSRSARGPRGRSESEQPNNRIPGQALDAGPPASRRAEDPSRLWTLGPPSGLKGRVGSWFGRRRATDAAVFVLCLQGGGDCSSSFRASALTVWSPCSCFCVGLSPGGRGNRPERERASTS